MCAFFQCGSQQSGIVKVALAAGVEMGPVSHIPVIFAVNDNPDSSGVPVAAVTHATMPESQPAQVISQHARMDARAVPMHVNEVVLPTKADLAAIASGTALPPSMHASKKKKNRRKLQHENENANERVHHHQHVQPMGARGSGPVKASVQRVEDIDTAHVASDSVHMHEQVQPHASYLHQQGLSIGHVDGGVVANHPSQNISSDDMPMHEEDECEQPHVHDMHGEHESFGASQQHVVQRSHEVNTSHVESEEGAVNTSSHSIGVARGASFESIAELRRNLGCSDTVKVSGQARSPREGLRDTHNSMHVPHATQALQEVFVQQEEECHNEDYGQSGENDLSYLLQS